MPEVPSSATTSVRSHASYGSGSGGDPDDEVKAIMVRAVNGMKAQEAHRFKLHFRMLQAKWKSSTEKHVAQLQHVIEQYQARAARFVHVCACAAPTPADVLNRATVHTALPPCVQGAVETLENQKKWLMGRVFEVEVGLEEAETVRRSAEAALQERSAMVAELEAKVRRALVYALYESRDAQVARSVHDAVCACARRCSGSRVKSSARRR